MDKQQRKRLEVLASSSIVGADIGAALVQIDRMGQALTYIAGSIGARDHERDIARDAIRGTEHRLVFSVAEDVPGAEMHFRNGAGEVLGKIVNLGQPETFETKEGEQAAHAHNREWLQPTANPFGHGCCDCGLYHQVEWRLVDKEGNIVHEGFMQKYGLQLSFTRDETETARLREHQGRESAQELRAKVERLKKLADDMNAAANTAFLDGRRNAIEEAAQLMEIQSPHLFFDPDYIAGKVRALAGKEKGEWVIHIIGPDDVLDRPDEVTALREANKLNIGLARLRAEDPSDHDPHCWAVVKNRATEPV